MSSPKTTPTPHATLDQIRAEIQAKKENQEKKEAKDELKWGCLPWALIIVGGGLCMTPLLPVGLVMVCIGAGMGGFGIAKGK